MVILQHAAFRLKIPLRPFRFFFRSLLFHIAVFSSKPLSQRVIFFTSPLLAGTPWQNKNIGVSFFHSTPSFEVTSINYTAATLVHNSKAKKKEGLGGRSWMLRLNTAAFDKNLTVRRVTGP